MANDLAAIDPMKKKLLDPNSLQSAGGAPAGWNPAAPVDPDMNKGYDMARPGVMDPNYHDAAVPGPTFNAGQPPLHDAAVPGPTFNAGAAMTPQQAAAAGLGWVDKNNPNYGKPGFVGSTPTPTAAPVLTANAAATPAPVATPAATPAAAAPAADMTPAQAAAAGLGWVDKNNPNYGKPGFVGSVAGATGAAGGATPGATAAAGADVPGAYQAALLKLLDEGGKTASLNDPALKAQSDAFSVGQQRSQERNRADSAERLAAQGLSSSGALDQAIAGGNEARGAAESGYNAGLVGDAAKQNLQKLQTALAMMGNDINSDKGRALQKQIADTQAQIQREGIAQQGALGHADIGLRDKLGSGGLNAQIMQMMMQNQQFGQGLGAQLGMFGAGQNQQALLALLGGL